MNLEVVAAALVGLAAVWLILQPLVAPGPSKPAVYEPPEPEETARGVALTALKEIEFDRETGKLSDEDYAFLKRKYTGEALEALRAEPAPGDRPEDARVPGPPAGAERAAPAGDVETLIAARVRALRTAATAAPAGTPVCAECGPRPEPDAVFCSNCGGRLAAGGACASCGATLAAGSRFCTGCGTGVAA
jgi:hypothetical protein